MESGENPIAIVICTHAAPLIAIGRVLTGRVPVEVGEDDFKTFTAGITRFERRDPRLPRQEDGAIKALCEEDRIPDVDWLNGKGVMGGWDCVLNGDCRHLEGGEERGWHFSGDESFPDTMEGSKL